MGTGNSCVKQQPAQPELKYPILFKIMHPLPSRQFPLEKPYYHSGIVDDFNEISYLEIILNTADTKKQQKEGVKQEDIEKIPQTAVQMTVLQTVETHNRKQSLDQSINQKLRYRSMTGNNAPEKKFQEKQSQQKISEDDCSVFAKKNKVNSDTQTVKSILKTNRTKSSKSQPKATHTGSQKKVSFNAETTKKKNRNFFM